MVHFPSLGDCDFSFRLPKKPAYGDEITIKALLREDAERFSINLCLERPEGCDPNAEPEWIAYHFGLHFSDNGGDCQVIQTSRNIDWHGDSFIHTDEGFNKRRVNIVLRLDEEKINVFHEDTQHCADYEYSPHFPIERIRSIELWDGIDRVEEIRLQFKQ